MSREIKFRVWCNCYENEPSMIHIPFKDFSQMSEVHDNIKTHIYMQYTGLKDKNGKEIYEGDIVKSKGDSSDKYVVLWIKEEARFNLYDSCGFIHTQYYGEFPHSEDMEVIGNIHENPELLEEYSKGEK